MNIPTTLRAGDSATWDDPSLVLPDGRTATSADWTLTYGLRGASKLDLVAVANSSGWRTTLSANAALQAGSYIALAVLTKGAERITVGSDDLTVLPDLMGQAAGYDPRTFAERSLADAEAALADLVASKRGVKEYSIAGREVRRYTPAELREAVDYWRGRVQRERAQKSLDAGTGDPRKLLVRFGRVS